MKKLILTVSLCAVAALGVHALNLSNQVNQYALATGQTGLAQSLSAQAIAVPATPAAVLVDPPRRPQEVTGRLHCASAGHYRECRTGLHNVRIIDVHLASRSCRWRTYGVHSGTGAIWVDDGCRADFVYRGHR